MTNETFSDRLKLAMQAKQFKQVDLIRAAQRRGVKLGKAMSASMSAEKRFRAPTFFTFWPMCSRSIPTGCLQKIPQ